MEAVLSNFTPSPSGRGRKGINIINSPIINERKRFFWWDFVSPIKIIKNEPIIKLRKLARE